MESYKAWCANEYFDEATRAELKSIEGNEKEFEDRFNKDIEFGTGGLRGTIGAGTNRMNIYTVAKASQGLSDYLVKSFTEPSVAIGYDSRIKSDVFAKTAASVFAANGIKVNLWPRLNPVPTVSFATRYLHASAGVMVTASHNPSKYNGYKVYGADGCQITTEAAAAVLAEIEKLDIFADVKKMDFDEAVKEGKIEYISDDVLTAFIEKVKSQSVLFGEEVNKNVSIVYSPLNGTGYIPVTRTLEEMGYTNITIVEEQRLPDGNFPTCPYPNPEIKEAMALGMDYAKRNNADLLLATDPDCDRVGIAVKDKNGDYQLLTGNQTGMLLFDYICSQRTKHNRMPADPVMVKTIVSMDMAEQIAKNYGVKVINVLTGFKFIGEQIGFLEKQGKEDSYIFGFEESYGYLSGSYVRDKDAVVAVMALCEAAAYYKTQGITLWDQMLNIYNKYGYYKEDLFTMTFKGADGAKKMQDMMDAYRKNTPKQVGAYKVLRLRDYKNDVITDLATGETVPTGLPKSNVLYFELENDAWFCVRPSGTEPKIKFYAGIKGTSLEDSAKKLDDLMEAIKNA